MKDTVEDVANDKRVRDAVEDVLDSANDKVEEETNGDKKSIGDFAKDA